MRTLYNHAARICTTAKHLQRQVSTRKKFRSLNGLPNTLLMRSCGSLNFHTNTSNKSKHDPQVKTIWILVPYASNAGEAIMKRLISKLKRCCKDKAYFKVLCKTRNLTSFCSTKDPIPFNLKSHVIYQLQCPGCENVSARFCLREPAATYTHCPLYHKTSV